MPFTLPSFWNKVLKGGLFDAQSMNASAGRFAFTAPWPPMTRGHAINYKLTMLHNTCINVQQETNTQKQQLKYQSRCSPHTQLRPPLVNDGRGPKNKLGPLPANQAARTCRLTLPWIQGTHMELRCAMQTCTWNTFWQSEGGRAFKPCTSLHSLLQLGIVNGLHEPFIMKQKPAW